MIYVIPLRQMGFPPPYIHAAAAKKVPGKQSEVWRSELSEKRLKSIDQQIPVEYSTLATCMLVLVSKYQQAGRECCEVSKHQISAGPGAAGGGFSDVIVFKT